IGGALALTVRQALCKFGAGKGVGCGGVAEHGAAWIVLVYCTEAGHSSGPHAPGHVKIITFTAERRDDAEWRRCCRRGSREQKGRANSHSPPQPHLDPLA